MKITIKQIDFSKASRIAKDFDGVIGLADFEKKVIWVDRALPEVSQGSKRLAVAHEKQHLLVHESGVKFPSKRSLEDYCEMAAVCATPNRYLSQAETILKKILVTGAEGKVLDWRKQMHRSEIISNILHKLWLQLDFEKLAGIKWDTPGVER